MNDLILKQEITKQRAKQFMKLGQISAYINTLLVLNQQKQLMKLVIAN